MLTFQIRVFINFHKYFFTCFLELDDFFLHVPDAIIANLENVGQLSKLHAHILDILDHISNEFVD